VGNVIAALCSFFIPGLEQLLQGRLFMAIIQFVLAGILWFFLLGWIIHLSLPSYCSVTKRRRARPRFAPSALLSYPGMCPLQGAFYGVSVGSPDRE
jgi:hypothetical protein